MTEEGGIKIHQIRRALCFSVKSQIEEQTLQATWSLSQPLTPALEHTGREGGHTQHVHKCDNRALVKACLSIKSGSGTHLVYGQ